MPEGGAPLGGRAEPWRRHMPRRRAAGVSAGGAPLGGGPEGLKVPVGFGGGVPLGGTPLAPWGGGPGGMPVPEGAGGAEPENWGAGAAWLTAAMAVTRAKM